MTRSCTSLLKRTYEAPWRPLIGTVPPAGSPCSCPTGPERASDRQQTMVAETGRGGRCDTWSGPGTPTRATSSTWWTSPSCCEPGDGSVRIEQDRHFLGVFPRATWLRLLEEVGFKATAVDVPDSGEWPEGAEVFLRPVLTV